jgi:hypothetical protein
MRHASAVVIVIMLLAGCTASSPAVAVKPQDDAIEAINEAVSEAIGTLREQSTPRGKDEEEDTTALPLPLIMKDLVLAAEGFVKATAGSPIETDAKSLLSSAQSLEKDAAGKSASELMASLQELSSKVRSLRSSN